MDGTEDDALWEHLVQSRQTSTDDADDADNAADDDEEVDFSAENDMYRQIPDPYTEEEYQRLWESDDNSDDEFAGFEEMDVVDASVIKMTSLCQLMLVVSMVTISMAGRCNMPPSLWCSTKETAENCGVLEQCTRAQTPDTSAGPVNLTLYFESLCPDCKRFFKEQLYHTYMALGDSVVNLTLVPYGNARERQDPSGKWKFECQHGPEECVGNLIETCANVLEKNKTASFLFIHCMEVSEYKPEQAAKQCAPQYLIDLDKVMQCANGNQGNDLEHQMAVQTNNLDPPHQYVPWVTVNGVHTEKMEHEAERDLLSLICDTYMGPKPDACKKQEWMNSKRIRCLRD